MIDVIILGKASTIAFINSGRAATIPLMIVIMPCIIIGIFSTNTETMLLISSLIMCGSIIDSFLKHARIIIMAW